MVKKLTPVKPLKATNPKPTPYHLQWGAGSTLGDVHVYATEQALRKQVAKLIKETIPWCIRHNPPGEKILIGMLEELGMTAIHREPTILEREYDDYYGMKLTFKIWME